MLARHFPAAFVLALALALLAPHTDAQAPRQPVQVSTGVSHAVATSGDLTVIASVSVDSLEVTTSDGRGVDWTSPVAINDALTSASELTPDAVRIQGSSVYVVWETPYGWALNASHDGCTSWIGPRAIPSTTTLEDLSYDLTDSGVFHAAHASNFFFATSELTLVSSLDGGLTFETPVVVAAPAALYAHDVELRTTGERIHLGYIPLFQELLYSRSDDGGATWTQATQLGNADMASSLVSGAVGSRIAFTYADHPGHGCDTAAPVLVVSEDAGDTWDTDVLAESPNQCPDLYYPGNIAFSGSATLFCWARTALTSDGFFVGRYDGGVSSETLILGASAPERGPSMAFAGPYGAVAVVGGNGTTRASLSRDGGSTWSAPVQVSTSAGGQSQSLVVFDEVYRNAIQTWAEAGTGVVTGGFRPQTVEPVGFVTGGSNTHYELAGFPQSETLFAVVALSLAPAQASYLVPDGRDLGLAFDSLSIVGFKIFGAVNTLIDANGEGSTKTIFATLDPGVTFYVVGVGFDAAIEATVITDVVQVQT